jgi:hypothetical protein
VELQRFMDNREGPMTEDAMARIEAIHLAHDGNFLRALAPPAVVSAVV